MNCMRWWMLPRWPDLLMLIMRSLPWSLDLLIIVDFAITPFTFHSHDYSLLIFIPLEGSIPEIINSNNLTITLLFPLGHKSRLLLSDFIFTFTFTFCSLFFWLIVIVPLFWQYLCIFHSSTFSVYPDSLIPHFFSLPIQLDFINHHSLNSCYILSDSAVYSYHSR